ncbi:hypothetical protein ACFVOR_20620 [Streptomyces sp. NPDC057837]|uniref:hypothetical protein n=1 Tax=Streptomyces sp. NPDC057837 TaxID=3346260 RepID=UPI0036B40665
MRLPLIVVLTLHNDAGRLGVPYAVRQAPVLLLSPGGTLVSLLSAPVAAAGGALSR